MKHFHRWQYDLKPIKDLDETLYIDKSGIPNIENTNGHQLVTDIPCGKVGARKCKCGKKQVHTRVRRFFEKISKYSEDPHYSWSELTLSDYLLYIKRVRHWEEYYRDSKESKAEEISRRKAEIMKVWIDKGHEAKGDNIIIGGFPVPVLELDGMSDEDLKLIYPMKVLKIKVRKVRRLKTIYEPYRSLFSEN